MHFGRPGVSRGLCVVHRRQMFPSDFQFFLSPLFTNFAGEFLNWPPAFMQERYKGSNPQKGVTNAHSH